MCNYCMRVLFLHEMPQPQTEKRGVICSFCPLDQPLCRPIYIHANTILKGILFRHWHACLHLSPSFILLREVRATTGTMEGKGKHHQILKLIVIAFQKENLIVCQEPQKLNGEPQWLIGSGMPTHAIMRGVLEVIVYVCVDLGAAHMIKPICFLAIFLQLVAVCGAHPVQYIPHHLHPGGKQIFVCILSWSQVQGRIQKIEQRVSTDRVFWKT